MISIVAALMANNNDASEMNKRSGTEGSARRVSVTRTFCYRRGETRTRLCLSLRADFTTMPLSFASAKSILQIVPRRTLTARLMAKQ